LRSGNAERRETVIKNVGWSPFALPLTWCTLACIVWGTFPAFALIMVFQTSILDTRYDCVQYTTSNFDEMYNYAMVYNYAMIYDRYNLFA